MVNQRWLIVVKKNNIMKYRVEREIINQVLTETTVKEEQLFREVAFSIVKELPIDKLKQLFNLKVVYGCESDLEKAYEENDVKKVEQIRQLIHKNSSLFTGEIDTFD